MAHVFGLGPHSGKHFHRGRRKAGLLGLGRVRLLEAEALNCNPFPSLSVVGLLSDKKDLKNSDLEGVILFEEVAAAIEEGKHGEERERERERERVRAQHER